MSSVQTAVAESGRIDFDNTYVRALPGCYAACQARPVAAPQMVYWNTQLASALGLALDGWSAEQRAACFVGNQLPAGAEPIAQAYAGHQFGHFNPQLGDGRALLIGEIINPQGLRFDLGLKGSGRTPYSRGGDGRAALGPMLREVLISEAMHALGVPTTRSLAVVATGEDVFREVLLPGAVLTRVAASHIRIGTFEYFAARGELEQLQRLADYTIARHDPALQGQDQVYLEFLRAVCQRQAQLIAQWMGLGFIHGVMNTDNMSIAGETIDYGPCAFMEAYRPEAVFSSIDAQGRYAFHNQPRIAQWNLARLAEALLPLFDLDQERGLQLASAVIDDFPQRFSAAWLTVMTGKLGIDTTPTALIEHDAQLIEDWLNLLHQQQVDFTLAWRYLADVAEGRPQRLLALFHTQAELLDWLQRWQQRVAQEALSPSGLAQRLRQRNPYIIPRNHRVEEALAAASQCHDYTAFERLLRALRQPFIESAENADYAQAAPSEFMQDYRTFCGT